MIQHYASALLSKRSVKFQLLLTILNSLQKKNMEKFTGYYSERKENTYDHNTYDREELSKEKHADDLKQIAEGKHEKVER